MIAELADALVVSFDRRQYGIEDDFVAVRLKAVDQAIQANSTDIVVAKGKLTLALAFDYYRRAIALAERHGLQDKRFGFTRLAVKEWRSKQATLEKQLNVSAQDQKADFPSAKALSGILSSNSGNRR